MPNSWFNKYCQKHYSEDKNSTEDQEFELFYELSEFDTNINTEQAWNKVSNKIRAKRNLWSSYWRIAAAVILVASLGIVGYQQFTKSPAPHYTQLASNSRLAKYQLPDGTQLTLSRESTVKLDEGSFSESRNLQLKGKAFFNVTKGSPFTIKTENGLVKVLGTSFDVDAKGEDLVVHVYSGVVEISNDRKKTKLTKGQVGILSNNQLKVQNFSGENTQAWRTGKFHFDNLPLREIIPQLEEYYDINIKASKALLDCKVTAQFDQQTLSEVVETLSKVLNAKHKKSGNKITFSGKGC